MTPSWILFLLLIIIHSLVILNTNYVYDLSENRTCNFFEIYDVNVLIKNLPVCSNKILIDNFLPDTIKIKNFPDKGWGLVSQRSFLKNDIIYKTQLVRFPTNDIEIISKDLGAKKIDKNIHCGDIGKKYDLFSYYDCFLNHKNEPSAYHDCDMLIEDGNIYIVLRAAKNINAGEEITINYLYLNLYIYHIRTYISYLVKYISFD